MAVSLVPLSDGPRVPIDKSLMFVGRDPDCDIVLTQSRRISRKHCCMALVNEQLMIRDLGSMNGVWINGKRVERQAELRIGDELAIGDVRFKISDDPAGSAPSEYAEASRDIPVVVSESADKFDQLQVALPASEDVLPLLDEDPGDVIPLIEDVVLENSDPDLPLLTD